MEKYKEEVKVFFTENGKNDLCGYRHWLEFGKEFKPRRMEEGLEFLKELILHWKESHKGGHGKPYYIYDLFLEDHCFGWNFEKTWTLPQEKWRFDFIESTVLKQIFGKNYQKFIKNYCQEREEKIKKYKRCFASNENPNEGVMVKTFWLKDL